MSFCCWWVLPLVMYLFKTIIGSPSSSVVIISRVIFLHSSALIPVCNISLKHSDWKGNLSLRDIKASSICFNWSTSKDRSLYLLPTHRLSSSLSIVIPPSSFRVGFNGGVGKHKVYLIMQIDHLLHRTHSFLYYPILLM